MKTLNNREIVGTLDTIKACAMIDSASFLEASDGIAFNYISETKVDWDSQTNDLSSGDLMFLDDAGEQWSRAELVESCKLLAGKREVLLMELPLGSSGRILVEVHLTDFGDFVAPTIFAPIAGRVGADQDPASSLDLSDFMAKAAKLYEEDPKLLWEAWEPYQQLQNHQRELRMRYAHELAAYLVRTRDGWVTNKDKTNGDDGQSTAK